MLPANPHFFDNKAKMKLRAKLNKKKLKLLEDTDLLLIPEKVNILSMMLGHKWVTDVAMGIKDNTSIVELLNTLELPHRPNQYTYEDITHTWLQIAASQAILDYVIERRDELTVLEAGVLYGYPVSHSLGYIGLIEKELKNDKSIAEFYLSGVFSKEYSDKESDYFASVWKNIIQQSKALEVQATEYYHQSTR